MKCLLVGFSQIILATLPSAAAEQFTFSKEDRYVGCIFGLVVPLLHQGKTREQASAYAFKHCERLGEGIEGNELEGLGDYISSLIDGLPTNRRSDH